MPLMSDRVRELSEQIIDRLKKGERGLVRLSATDEQLVLTHWDELSGENFLDQQRLRELLCVLDHTERAVHGMDRLLIRDLVKIEQNDLLVLTLGVALKQVIDAAVVNGGPVSGEYVLALKELLLKNPTPEVFEWILRNLEELGPRSILVKEEVRRLRPGFSRLWNTHQRHCVELIDHLEARWSRLNARPS
jgi:hypothetical protein